MNRIRTGIDYVDYGRSRPPRRALQLVLGAIAISAFGSAWLLHDGASAAADPAVGQAEAVVEAAGGQIASAASAQPEGAAATAVTPSGDDADQLTIPVNAVLNGKAAAQPSTLLAMTHDSSAARAALAQPLVSAQPSAQVAASEAAAIGDADDGGDDGDESPDEDVVSAIAKQIDDKPAAPIHLPKGLKLKSSVVLVVDQKSGDVLAAQNADRVQPIASLTKLMTALVISEAHQPMDEKLEITSADIDRIKHSYSRLQPGMTFTRRELLLLALMSSENRAASALGRHYPGGFQAFVSAMNAKAKSLGMTHTHYHDANGLSSQNVSNAEDLVKLVKAAYQVPLIRDFSTNVQHTVHPGRRSLHYVSSNRLVRARNDWHIGLQKTGFTNEAGHCLVMQATVKGRPLIMVLLDSDGKLTRFADAQRVRRWINSGKAHIASSARGHSASAS